MCAKQKPRGEIPTGLLKNLAVPTFALVGGGHRPGKLDDCVRNGDKLRLTEPQMHRLKCAFERIEHETEDLERNHAQQGLVA